jgi:beta-lactamase class D
VKSAYYTQFTLAALLFSAGAFCHAPAQTTRLTTIPEKYYHGFGGGFIMYDRNADTYTVFRPEACRRRLSPASTFKILNSLIGLESGVISDEHFIIPWDSVHREFESWNRDHDLASAMANSVVWYYQELARRVGRTRMTAYIDSTEYGNNDLSGPVDRFWLGNTLLISAEEQVGFLRRLYDGRLPFSLRSIGIAKEILVLERNEGYVLNPARDGDRIFNGRKTTAIAILRELGIF